MNGEQLAHACQPFYNILTSIDEKLGRIADMQQKRLELLEQSNSLQRESMTHTYEHDAVILKTLQEPAIENVGAHMRERIDKLFDGLEAEGKEATK